MAATYLDATAFMRRLMRDPGALASQPWRVPLSSELLRVEVARTLHRFWVTGKLPERDFAGKAELARHAFASIELVPLDPIVLERAASGFATPVGALDAIHLATALVWREQTGSALVFLTYDEERATAARASGLEVRTV